MARVVFTRDGVERIDPMFTGIIEDLGSVLTCRHRADSAVLKIETHLPPSSFQLGDSVAVDGACLTISRMEEGVLTFVVSHESIRTTSLKFLNTNDVVHLERALSLGSRLGGHLVTGHVDGLGEIVDKKNQADNLDLTIAADENISPYLVPKGSVAVAGVSLTINQPRGNRFRITLVPHTLAKTNLGKWNPGKKLNLEADILGKYVHHFTGPRTHNAINKNLLVEHGFLAPDDLEG